MAWGEDRCSGEGRDIRGNWPPCTRTAREQAQQSDRPIYELSQQFHVGGESDKDGKRQRVKKEFVYGILVDIKLRDGWSQMVLFLTSSFMAGR